MYSVRADRDNNRLIIVLAGFVNTSDAEKVVDGIVVESSKLKPGFDVITDLTKYSLGNLKATKSLHHAMEFLKTRGVRHVVRVVGRSKMALMQFARATLGFRGYKPIYVTSMELAEKKLGELVAR